MSRFRVIPVVLALGFCLFGQVSGQGILGPAPHPCGQQELEGKSCASPGLCTNACARYCAGKSECNWCCLVFAYNQSAYQACRQFCTDVWPE